MTFSKSHSPKVADLWLSWDSYPSTLKNITIICMATSIPILLLSSISGIRGEKVGQSKSLWKTKLLFRNSPECGFTFFFFSFFNQETFPYILSNKIRALPCNLLVLGFKVNNVTDFHHTLENLLVYVFFQLLKWWG